MSKAKKIVFRIFITIVAVAYLVAFAYIGYFVYNVIKIGVLTYELLHPKDIMETEYFSTKC